MDRERSRSVDPVLSAVGNEYRRAILDALTSASDETLAFEALVDRVTDWIRDEDAGPAPDEHRHRVRIMLHHTHIPKLEAVGSIDRESGTGLVRFVGGGLERDLHTLAALYDPAE